MSRSALRRCLLRVLFGRRAQGPRRVRRLALLLGAACCGGLALIQLTSAQAETVIPIHEAARPKGSAAREAKLATAGHELFLSSCAACHGFKAQGIHGRAPSLHGVGAAAAAFYLETGRMPLPSSREQPTEKEPAFPEHQIKELIAYVASFGGPAIPRVDTSKGSIAKGQELFAFNCAGCHTIQGAGGIVTGAVVPALGTASATVIGEAIRTGPYVMPRFSSEVLSKEDVDSIAAYVRTTQHPDDLGGWGIGRIGPIPEGMVAWMLALGSLLLIARLLGERVPEQPRSGTPESGGEA